MRALQTPTAARRSAIAVLSRGAGRAVRLGALACALLGTPPRSAAAQPPAVRGAPPPAPPPAPQLPATEVEALAATYVALLALQDSANHALARPSNKTDEAQQRLREAHRAAVTALLSARGLSEQEYQRRRFAVSTDGASRQRFDSVVTVLSGAPLPGARAVAAATAGAPAPAPRGATPPPAGARAAADAPSAPQPPALPPGPVGTHVGHVAVRFGDTPGQAGLLAVAQQEAKAAADHAAFAARAAADLPAMQRHAGHVLHAIDPTLAPSGPGTGYGLRKAATGVAAHIEMAAQADGAPAAVRLHAGHVAAAARSTLARAEAVVQLAGRIRAATTAADAAALVGQLASLCEQLQSGTDLDADGRVTWGAGEGGLQQAAEHLRLLVGALTSG